VRILTGTREKSVEEGECNDATSVCHTEERKQQDRRDEDYTREDIQGPEFIC
jgi:hypothetical protein